MEHVEVIKVSAKSVPKSVAGALAGLIKENNQIEIHAIGAGALNQSIKAVAIARGFVAPKGLDLIITPAFSETVIDGAERTCMKLTVEAR